MHATPTTLGRLIHLGGFGVVFLLYTLTNAYTDKLSQTHLIANVATVMDGYMPFVPASVVIYLCSVPLIVYLYLSAEYIDKCREISAYLILSTLIAVLCFYITPLQVSYPSKLPIQYQAWGIDWQFAYRILGRMDKPFNQLPSLHACYASIAIIIISKQSCINRLYRYGLIILSGLVIISTLTTHQHHLYDVLFGVLLAVLVIYGYRLLLKHHLDYQLQLMLKYLVIAVAGFLIINCLPLLLFDIRTHWLIMTFGYYHLLSFLLLAMCYANYLPCQKLRHHIFKKSSSGQLSILAYFLMLPILLIYQMMWRVSDFIGRLTFPKDTLLIQDKLEILAIANPTYDFIALKKQHWQNYQRIIWIDLGSENSSHYRLCSHPNSYYAQIPVLDLMPMMSEKKKIIHTLRWIKHQLSERERTLIVCQCSMGLQRSVAMLLCVMAFFRRDISHDKLYEIIRTAYPYHHVGVSILTDDFIAMIQDIDNNHDKDSGHV